MACHECETAQEREGANMDLTAEQRRFYAREGYLFLEALIPENEVDVLRLAAVAALAEDSPRRVLEKDGVTVRSVHGSHTTDDVFARLVRHPRLLGPARQLVGGDVHVYQFKINAKKGFGGDIWEWHQDFIFWHHEDGMPEPRVLTVTLFLDEVNEHNGPIILLPGSHQRGMIDVAGKGSAEGRYDSPAWVADLTADLDEYSLRPETIADLVHRCGTVAPTGPAGSVLLFDSNTVHGSAANVSPSDRKLLLIRYNSVENRLGDVANPRPEFVASRDYTPVLPLPDDSLLADAR